MFALARAFAGRRRPAGPEEPFREGLRALDAGRADDALAAFTRAAEEAPDPRGRASALNKRALARLLSGDREGALADLAAALGDDPGCVAAIVNVGNLLLEDDALDEAIAHYEAALRRDERSALAHQNLAVALRRTGDRAGSVRHLRRAAQLERAAAWTTVWDAWRSRRRA